MMETETAAETLKAFSHPTRLSILQELLAGPKCVTDMEELLPVRQANLSRPRLVGDMLKLLGREEPVIKRSPAQLKADKQRRERARQRLKIPFV